MTMTPDGFLVTSALLGLMVLAAGAYGSLYAAARLTKKRTLLALAAAAYGMLTVDATCVVVASSLGPAWKLLIAASALAYVAIPPITWRYMRRTHAGEKGVRP